MNSEICKCIFSRPWKPTDLTTSHFVFRSEVHGLETKTARSQDGLASDVNETLWSENEMRPSVFCPRRDRERDLQHSHETAMFIFTSVLRLP